jgi:CCR4-NOT transcription complex subunit 1
MLDVCQDLKALPAALDRAPHALAVELAALAARREYLNLEKWLQERAAASGAPFAAACLRFLRARATGDDAGTLTPGAPKLAVETMAIFFKTLQAGAGGLPPDLRQELQGVAAAAARAHPTLASVVAGAGGAPGAVTPGEGLGGGGGGSAGGTFPADVEAEANANFQRLYSGTRSAEQTAEMLARFRASRDARERDVFGCMVHNLFDEYRFFPKYPEKELRVTAVLFGRLIDLQLVASITLGVALRCVLDALRKPFGTKMFAFGSEALEQFKQRLPEWPQYCQHLAAVPHLAQAHPDLAQLLGAAAERRGAARLGRDEPELVAHGPESVLAAGVAGMNLSGDGGVGMGANAAPPPPAPRPPAPPGAPPGGASEGGLHHAQSMPAMKSGGGGSGLLSQGSAPGGLLASSGSAANLGPAAPVERGGGSGFATSLNLETLLAAGSNQNIVVPDAETVDKVHFVVNNLSLQNMAEKAAEVTNRVSPEQYGWFAVYLVVKRASIEPNFHALYLGLLDAIGDETLFRLVLDASYSNIKALLSSDKVKTNSGERSLLKNLGSWLGGLTISRNQPVLMRDLDVKALVLESYQTGHMIAVIPFVAKVLEPAKDSVIFKPPNPWTAAVLGLLKEIYGERDLKLNLKFEMERLFKHLEVEIKDQKPSYLLHQVRRDRVNNPDFAADKNSAQPGGGLGGHVWRGRKPRVHDGRRRAVRTAKRDGLAGGAGDGRPRRSEATRSRSRVAFPARESSRTTPPREVCSSTSRSRRRRTFRRRCASRWLASRRWR